MENDDIKLAGSINSAVCAACGAAFLILLLVDFLK